MRQLLLAVQVIHDLDLEILDRCVVLPGRPVVRVRHASLPVALAGTAPDSPAAPARLAEWLRRRRTLADWGAQTVLERLRPVGLPPGHVRHPGPGFAVHLVLGGALEVGLGVLGLDPGEPDSVAVLAPSLWAAVGVVPATHWPAARELLERMGALAAARWRLDPAGQLRPMGDCDVPTLLASAALRAVLAEDCGGMTGAVVPMRSRGWTRLSRLDPAFGPAAAAATPSRDRGFTRPLLVTADEVVQVADGGNPARWVRDDPAPRAWQVAAR